MINKIKKNWPYNFQYFVKLLIIIGFVAYCIYTYVEVRRFAILMFCIFAVVMSVVGLHYFVVTAAQSIAFLLTVILIKKEVISDNNISSLPDKWKKRFFKKFEV